VRVSAIARFGDEEDFDANGGVFLRFRDVDASDDALSVPPSSFTSSDWALRLHDEENEDLIEPSSAEGFSSFSAASLEPSDQSSTGNPACASSSSSTGTPAIESEGEDGHASQPLSSMSTRVTSAAKSSSSLSE